MIHSIKRRIQAAITETERSRLRAEAEARKGCRPPMGTRSVAASYRATRLEGHIAGLQEALTIIGEYEAAS